MQANKAVTADPGRSPASRFRMIVPFRAEDPFGIALGIVVLPAAQRPDEGQEAKPAKPQRDRNEKAEDFHLPPLYRSRSAFSVTLIELSDMASAAIRGVAKPAMAMGTATML